MKKIYVIMALLVVVIVVGAWYLFSNAFSWANYTNELADALNASLEAGTLAAEYQGERHPITTDSVDGVLRVLRRGASEVQSVKAPPATYDGKITIYFSDMTFNMYCEQKDVDTVVMERVKDGRSNCTSLSGYEMFKWLLHATGFEWETE